jgi:hypothetical protein
MCSSMKAFRCGLVTFGLAVAVLAVEAAADPGSPVLRVEEDWVLVLNVPGESKESPHLDSMYFQVNWNYRENPEYEPGGLEITCWEGDSLRTHQSMRDEQLSTYAETITWTQRLVTDGELISFQIVNGQSTTWGPFGGMTLDRAFPMRDLDRYNPNLSAGNSLITYGSNRVNLLVLAEVRMYDADGQLVKRDTMPRVIYEAEDE